MSLSELPRRGTTLRGRSAILFGGDLSSGGGVNRIVRDLAVILDSRLGMDVTVVSLTDRAPSYCFPPSVAIESYPGVDSSRSFLRLLRRINTRKPDFVIGFWHWSNIRISLNAALFGQRAIVTEHTSWYHPPRRTRWTRALIYRFTKAVCVLNPAELNHYQKFLGNVVLLPNPVPTQPTDVPVKEKLIIAVGHLIDRKNFRDAIFAMATSGIANDGWRLTIIGEGPEHVALNRLIGELGLQDAIDIVPPTSDIAAWYRRAAIILVTSTIEVFSLALAEAMSMEVVPLAYAADGPAYLLRDHADLLVTPGNAMQLGEQLGRLCRSGDLPRRGLAVSRVIRSRFSEDVIAEQWRELLERAIG